VGSGVAEGFGVFVGFGVAVGFGVFVGLGVRSAISVRVFPAYSTVSPLPSAQKQYPRITASATAQHAIMISFFIFLIPGGRKPSSASPVRIPEAADRPGRRRAPAVFFPAR
jgi:hypothetical protein